MSSGWFAVRLPLSALLIAARMAYANLWASRLKTFIAGTILFCGACGIVLGASVAASMYRGIAHSVIDSVAGDVQVYGAASKDELALIDTTTFDPPDLVDLDLAKVNRALAKVSNVASVVPMAIGGTAIPTPNSIDRALEKLRARVQQGGTANGVGDAGWEPEKARVRQTIQILKQADVGGAVASAAPNKVRERQALARALSAEFWKDFDRDPQANLEFLENQVAPQVPDSGMLFLRYIGTNPTAFQRAFKRMRIVDGTGIPEGHRGFLFAKDGYEDQLKLKVARRLDKIKAARDERGETLASSGELQRYVRENYTQPREILMQLDAAQAKTVSGLLQAELGSRSADLRTLLVEFLHMNDANFERRYRFFYDTLAPYLELYRIRIGEPLPLRAFNKSGYLASVSVRLYGTFQFVGLERSPLASNVNLMDLATFRELAGTGSSQSEQERSELRRQMQVAPLAREQVEAELFGKAQPAEDDAPALAEISDVQAPSPDISAGGNLTEKLADRPVDPREYEEGPISSTAVFLSDTTKADETSAAIVRAGQEANLSLKVVPWQKAAGLVGEFVTTISIVLYLSLLVIFVVSLVIINNALVMTTLERVADIGTLRAIGARRSLIVMMVVMEATGLAAIFGGLGALAGALLTLLVGRHGIAAMNDSFYFFFAGPSLHPTVSSWHILTAFVVVLMISILSALYPAYLAMRVTPRQAMQETE